MEWVFTAALAADTDPVIREAFFALPGLILGYSTSTIAARLHRVYAGDFAGARNAVRSHAVDQHQRQRPSRPLNSIAVRRRQHRAVQLAYTGHYRRACRLLLSMDPAPRTTTTWDNSAYLFPEPHANRLHPDLEAVLASAADDSRPRPALPSGHHIRQQSTSGLQETGA